MTNSDTLGWILYYTCNLVPFNKIVFLYYCFVMTIIGLCALYLHYREISWKYWLLILFCTYTWGIMIYWGYMHRIKGAVTYEIIYAGNVVGAQDHTDRFEWVGVAENLINKHEYAKTDVKLMTINIIQWTVVLLIAGILIKRRAEERIKL